MRLPSILASALAGGFACAILAQSGAPSIDVKRTETFRAIKAHLEATPAIDTHDHLPPFGQIAGRVETERGRGMTLFSLWQSSYYTWFNPLSPMAEIGEFPGMVGGGET